MLTQQRLKELLHYEPETGVFTRLVTVNYRAMKGSVAGCLASTGYLYIRIDYKLYRAHRLAWLYVYGEWPNDTDHENHERTDNRIINLRSVASQENSKNQSISSNNTSGIVGVGWNKRNSAWAASVRLNSKNIFLGYYNTKLAAAYARHAANIKYGFHKNHGR